MVKVARIHAHGVARLSRIVTPQDVEGIVSNLSQGLLTFNGHYVSIGAVEDEKFIYYDLQTVQQRQAASKKKYAGVCLAQSVGEILKRSGIHTY